MSWSLIVVVRISFNVPLLCEVCRSPKATGGDFAFLHNINRILQLILPQRQTYAKSMTEANLGEAPKADNPVISRSASTAVIGWNI